MRETKQGKSGMLSQSGLEYLITYGWAILLVAIIVGVFYYFVVLPFSIVPTICSVASGLKCDDVVVGSSGGSANVVLLLTNTQPFAIQNITASIGISGRNTTARCLTGYASPGGSVICVVKVPQGYSAGQLLAGVIRINAQYCALAQEQFNRTSCNSAPREVYAGSFSVHSSGLFTPSVKINLQASPNPGIQGSLTAVKATVTLGNYPIRGATLNFTSNSSSFSVNPKLVSTDSFGNATAYVYPSIAGNALITANYSNATGSVAVQFLQSNAVNPGNLPPVGVSISPTSATIDSDQQQTFTATVYGGSPPYSYIWNIPYGASKLSGCNASSSDCTLSGGIGTFTISVQATSPGYGVSSPADAVFTVNPRLVGGAIAPDGPVLDSGQQLTLTSTSPGGTPPYTYTWYGMGPNYGYYGGLDGICSDDSNIAGPVVQTGPFSSFSDSPTANAYYCYQVQDSAGESAYSSGEDFVRVSPALYAGPPSPSPPVADYGTFIGVSPAAGGGTLPRTYRWYESPFGVKGICSTGTYATTTSDQYPTFYPSSSYLQVGTNPFCYSVTDSATSPVTLYSTVSNVIINPALSATISADPSSPESLYLGQGTQIKVSTGVTGTPPFSVNIFNSTTAASCSNGGLKTLVASYSTWSSSSGVGNVPIPTSPKTIYFCAQVSDTSASTVWTGTTSVYVGAAQDLSGILTSVDNSAFYLGIDLGSSTQLILSISANPGYTSYTIYACNDPSCATRSVVKSWSGPTSASTPIKASNTPTTTGLALYYADLAYDGSSGGSSKSQRVPSSGYLGVVVNDPVSISVSPSQTVDQAQTAQVTATITGGTEDPSGGPHHDYFYQWYATPANGGTFSISQATLLCGINSANGLTEDSPATVTCPFATSPSTSLGTYQFYLQVRDLPPSAEPYFTSGTTSVSVNPQVSGNLQLDKAVIDKGMQVTATTSSYGGTGTKTIQVFNSICSNGSCPGTYKGFSGVLTDQPTPATTPQTLYYYSVIRDSGTTQQTYTTSKVPLLVNPPMSITSFSCGPQNVQLGSSTICSVYVAGGTPPYTFSFYPNSACSGSAVAQRTGSATTDSASIVPSAFQTTYCAKVTDSAGASLTQSLPSPVGTVSPYPTFVRLQSCVYLDGYIYCVGGNTNPTDGSQLSNAVYSAPAANGAVGSWTRLSVADYPLPIDRQSCTTFGVYPGSGGYILCAGGQINVVGQVPGFRSVKKVYALKVVNGAGSGSWISLPDLYDNASAGLSCVNYPDGGGSAWSDGKDMISCIGGLSLAGGYPTAISSRINNLTIANGASLTSPRWTSTDNAYPFTIYGESCISSRDGVIACFGGQKDTTIYNTNSVEMAYSVGIYGYYSNMFSTESRVSGAFPQGYSNLMSCIYPGVCIGGLSLSTTASYTNGVYLSKFTDDYYFPSLILPGGQGNPNGVGAPLPVPSNRLLGSPSCVVDSIDPDSSSSIYCITPDSQYAAAQVHTISFSKLFDPLSQAWT